MSTGIKSVLCLLSGVSCLLFSACSLPEAQPDRTRFFVLTTTPGKAEGAADAAAQPVRVVLRTVIVPDFLRGKIMAVRIGDNEVRFIDEARWAEPIEPGLTRVLREDLAHRPAVQVAARGEAHDFEVAVQLRHCEGALPAGVARLAAQVEIFSV